MKTIKSNPRKENAIKNVAATNFFYAKYSQYTQMAKDYQRADKESMSIMVHRRALKLIFYLGLFSMSTSLILFSSLQISFAQLPSSTETMPSQEVQGANGQLGELEAARQQFLSVWNNTAFTSQFDVFVAEGSDTGYGIYREHVPANVFRPGETIVLYMEPVGFGHQVISDSTNIPDGGTSTATPRTVYLINMTADIIISDSTGTELQRFEDVPVGELISHNQNLEMLLTLTVSQSQPFPEGDYTLTYIVHDQVTGQRFQIDRGITIDDSVLTGAAPLPGTPDDTSSEQLVPQ